MTVKKLKNIVRNILIVILTVVLAVSMYEVIDFLRQNHQENAAIAKINEAIQPNIKIENSEFVFTHEAWKQLKAVNDDFIGYLAFPDQYVSEPVVKAHDRSYYLKHWIDRTWNSQGTVYMDQTNELTDQNITMYGHNVTYDSKAKFSPLTKLVNQKDYDKHHIFKIWYEQEVASYEIEAVYYYDVDKDTAFNFRQNNFTDDTEVYRFLENIRNRNEILSAGGMTKDDRFVTFQTCRDYSSSVRIIIVAKETGRSAY